MELRGKVYRNNSVLYIIIIDESSSIIIEIFYITIDNEATYIFVAALLFFDRAVIWLAIGIPGPPSFVPAFGPPGNKTRIPA